MGVRSWGWLAEQIPLQPVGKCLKRGPLEPLLGRCRARHHLSRYAARGIPPRSRVEPLRSFDVRPLAFIESAGLVAVEALQLLSQVARGPEIAAVFEVLERVNQIPPRREGPRLGRARN